jgi:hypothetical protein
MSLDKLVKGMMHRAGLGERPYEPLSQGEVQKQVEHYVRLIKESEHGAGVLELRSFLEASFETKDKKSVLAGVESGVEALTDFEGKEAALLHLKEIEESFTKTK